jgi:lipopolysaccharide/colanic/teichoic acid biosynthesis glycosyltransferase
MSVQKRLMDISLALLLCLILGPVLLILALVVLIKDGRPVFYRSERMKRPDQAFQLWKFRTMSEDRNDSGVTAGYKAARVTKMGHWLRRHRLDELPQLINILRGDMSFVGPRPPLRCYVDMHPALYARVLQNRPGVTGLATLYFYHREEKLLAACASATETEELYIRRCIPMKARLDLIWAKNQSLCYDALLISETVFRVFSRRTKKTTAS